MGVSRPIRSFDREFKAQVARQLLGGEKRLARFCREHQISATLIRRWKERYEQQGETAWSEFGSLMVAPDAESCI